MGKHTTDTKHTPKHTLTLNYPFSPMATFPSRITTGPHAWVRAPSLPGNFPLTPPFPPYPRSEIVLEFLREGFAHVAIVRGGYASLSPEQRAAILVSDDVAPDFSDPRPAQDRLANAMAAAERARVEAAEGAKRAGEAMKKVFSFARKPKPDGRRESAKEKE
jgi:hypothetical protein